MPTIDIGTRQLNRAKLKTITHCDYEIESILHAINVVLNGTHQNNELQNYFGDGKSDKKFLDLLDSGALWQIKHQKQFMELD